MSTQTTPTLLNAARWLQELQKQQDEDHCTCGERCPTCGKRKREVQPFQPYPSPWQPSPFYPPANYPPANPWSPWITWTSTGANSYQEV